MPRRITLVAALSLLAGLSNSEAQTPIDPALQDARARYAAAFLYGDVKTLDDFETPNFRVVVDEGTREEILGMEGRYARLERQFAERRAAIGEPPSGIERVSEELDVRTFGDVAIVSGREVTRIPGRPEEPTDHILFTEVWINHGGRWQIAHYQFSVLGTESEQ